MTRGLRRDQTGITEEMVRAYGELVFEMSHNLQVRRGDAVRLLDWERIEARREGAGLADVQIAERLGLTREQVTHIRLAMERRKFRRTSYHRLYDLGGGRRYRAERYTPPEERFAFGADALALRKALAFDPDDAARYIRDGSWNADTVGAWLERRAVETPDLAAVVDREADETITFAALRARAARIAGGLHRVGVTKGEVVALGLASALDFVACFHAVAMLGAVCCPLPPRLAADGLAAALRRARARALVGDGPEGETLAGLLGADPVHDVDPAPVATDPVLHLFAAWTDEPRRGVVHSHQTLLANVRAAAPRFGFGAGDRVTPEVPMWAPFGLWSMLVALHAGATLVGSGETADGSVARLPDAAGRVTGALCLAETMVALVGDGRDGALGSTVPGIEARSVRADGEVVADGEAGELQLRGCSVVPCYFDDDAANRAGFSGDGWLRAGLTVRIDADGAVDAAESGADQRAASRV